MNTNVADYTVEDLLAILNINDEEPTEFQIKDAARNLTTRLKQENKQNLAVFIEQAERKVIAALFSAEAEDEDEEEDEEEDEDVAYTNDRANIQYDENTQQGNFWQNQYPAQTNDEVERTKPTDRKQKVQIFDKEGVENNAFVMNRERLGVLQSHPIPYVQGTINPNLKTTIKRIVSIDSQYRPNVIPYAGNNTSAPTFNTDFSCDLTERLTNVVSMTLNSIQIPTSWYIFSDDLGNTCFKYQVGDAEPLLVKIPSGLHRRELPEEGWFTA